MTAIFIENNSVYKHVKIQTSKQTHRDSDRETKAKEDKKLRQRKKESFCAREQDGEIGRERRKVIDNVKNV